MVSWPISVKIKIVCLICRCNVPVLNQAMSRYSDAFRARGVPVIVACLTLYVSRHRLIDVVIFIAFCVFFFWDTQERSDPLSYH